MTKQAIRKQYKAIRNAIPIEARAAKSAAISRAVMSSAIYAEADWLYAFLSFGSEAETRGIIEDALARGKHVAVPVTGANGAMEFVVLTSFDELAENAYGVPEPVNGEAVFPSGAEKVLMLAPGLVFGRDGFRVGYGKGFYDRYLCRVREANPQWREVFTCIGIGFEEQLADTVLHDAYDIALDGVWTDKSLISFEHI